MNVHADTLATNYLRDNYSEPSKTVPFISLPPKSASLSMVKLSDYALPNISDKQLATHEFAGSSWIEQLVLSNTSSDPSTRMFQERHSSALWRTAPRSS